MGENQLCVFHSLLGETQWLDQCLHHRLTMTERDQLFEVVNNAGEMLRGSLAKNELTSIQHNQQPCLLLSTSSNQARERNFTCHWTLKKKTNTKGIWAAEVHPSDLALNGVANQRGCRGVVSASWLSTAWDLSDNINIWRLPTTDDSGGGDEGRKEQTRRTVFLSHCQPSQQAANSHNLCRSREVEMRHSNRWHLGRTMWAKSRISVTQRERAETSGMTWQSVLVVKTHRFSSWSKNRLRLCWSYMPSTSVLKPSHAPNVETTWTRSLPLRGGDSATRASSGSKNKDWSRGHSGQFNHRLSLRHVGLLYHLIRVPILDFHSRYNTDVSTISADTNINCGVEI